MKELRKKERRHDFDSAQLFPFVDRSSRIVLQDRRRGQRTSVVKGYTRAGRSLAW